MKLRSPFLGLIVLAMLLVATGSALAQPQPPSSRSHRRSVELGGSFLWLGASSTVSTKATLTTPGGSPLTLFETSNRIDMGLGVEAHIALPLATRLVAEAGGSWIRADLSSRVSGDFEGAPAMTVTQPISEVTVEGAGVWRLAGTGRLQPFARGSAGWMRQVTADRVLLRDGLIASAGGGIKYWLAERSRGRIHRFGLRVDARLVIRSRSLLLGDRRTISPALAGGVALAF
jgi:hypothetical protein